MDKAFYFDALYPFQDEVLGAVAQAQTKFYLTGGTAASRGYLQHRFSDDLGLFVNDDPEFGLYADRLIQSLVRIGRWETQVLLRESRVVRCAVRARDITLKIEMVNDVPARLGAIRDHETLGRLDSPENILANKVTALVDRTEPKDLADVWGFCSKLRLELKEAIEGAHSKAAGIFAPDLARILCSATVSDWELVRWIEPPSPKHFLDVLRRLGEELILDYPQP